MGKNSHFRNLFLHLPKRLSKNNHRHHSPGKYRGGGSNLRGLSEHKEILTLLDGIILTIFVLEALIKFLPRAIARSITLKTLGTPLTSPLLRLASLSQSYRWENFSSRTPSGKNPSRPETGDHTQASGLVSCLLKSLPSMFYVSILLFLLFYVRHHGGVSLWRERSY